MTTRIDEIAPGIYRLSTHVAEVAPPAGFGFNQFVVMGDEPLLFHCGMRGLFPSVSRALARLMPIERLRWIAFGHLEADESGAMNAWLAAAPRSQVAHGALGCAVSVADLADRPPRPLVDDERIDLGGKVVRYLATPHVPHGWDAGVMVEETTGTLLCGDLFTRVGSGPAITTDDIVAPAIETEEMFESTVLSPLAAPTLRRLAALAPARLATMHGSSFEGDAGRALEELAGYYDRRLRAALAPAAGAAGSA